MQFHRQLNPHIPEIGLIGDCFRTCLACMLNLHPSEVPNFAEIGYDSGTEYVSPEAQEAVQTFLRELGLTLIEYPVADNPVEMVTKSLAFINGEDFCYMLSGKGAAGHGHVCLYRGSELLWCPSGTKGIVGAHPAVDDTPALYWVKILGSMRSRYTPGEGDVV